MKIQISPSLAAGNLLKIEEEVRRLEKAKADMIHVDVMDGHFVPLLTIGVPILEALRSITDLPLDVHIMVANPDAVVDDYLKAGADILTFQVEASLHAHRLCQRIRGAGKRAGIALNPSTHWRAVEFLLPVVDQITIMAVNPGYSRQAHLPEVHPKIRELSQHCRSQGFPCVIQIDGGVNPSNAATLVQLGATNLVAGGAIMGQADYGDAISRLKLAASTQTT